ncbi:MAG: PAS domain-containing protein, partial [Alphaproteobacteria bacterium]|nr:PAS domain-containing protein [Alphaproteobacteria bacterium]
AGQEIHVTDPERRVLCSSNRGAVGIWVGDREHIRKALATGTFVIGSRINSRTNGTPTVPFAIAYRRGDGRQGVVTMSVGLDWLHASLAGKPLPPNTSIILADRHGGPLAQIPEPPGGGGALPAAFEALTARTTDGIVELLDPEGVPRVVAYSPAEAGMRGIFFAVGLDKRVVRAPVETAWRFGQFSLGLALAAAIAAAIGAHRLWLKRPIEAIVGVAEGWSRGDFSVRLQARGIEEIAHLSSALNAVAEAAADRERSLSLAASVERRMADIFASISDGVVEAGADGRIAFANHKARSLLASGQLIGDDLRDVLPNAEFRAAFERVAETGRTEEVESWHEAGAHWLTARAVRSAEGIAIAIADVTARRSAQLALRQADRERRAALAQLETLLENAPLGFAFFDAEHRFVRLNEVLARIDGMSVAAHLGRRIEDLMPANGAAIAPILDEVLATGRAVAHHEMSGETPAQPGVRRHWLTSFYPVDPHGDSRHVGAVVMEISALKEAERDLRAAKEEAEEANLAKSKFLAAASHDLRQPVQSLLLLASALRTALDRHPAQRLVDHVTTSVQSLRQLLESLLDISRLDAGIVEADIRPVEIGELLDRLRDEYAPRAAAAGLRLRVVRRGGMVASDPVLLQRVLRNLIENAIRYTRKGGIVVGCRRRGDRLRIDVVDSGIGVPPEEHGRIFREFVQIDNPARDRNLGLGLGLSIVKRLAEVLGARIFVESTPGVGSRFSVEVPRCASEVEPARPTVTEGRGLAGRVLIIDDEPLLRLALTLQLGDWGLEVMDAADADQAVRHVRFTGVAPDVVIADYRLADGRTGIEAIAAVTAVAGPPRHSVVLTGDTAPDRIAEVRRSGHHLLHKPVSPDVLRKRLESWLSPVA